MPELLSFNLRPQRNGKQNLRLKSLFGAGCWTQEFLADGALHASAVRVVGREFEWQSGSKRLADVLGIVLLIWKCWLQEACENMA